MTDITAEAKIEPIQDWRTRWATECPMTIAVTYAGWESGSDAALRDELKRIRDTGFNAVRVHFDRDNDIEKMAGMINWRNPDRFFDAAEKAVLKVIAAPGNFPHRSLEMDVYPVKPLSEDALANVTAWLKKFCGQYKAHPALLAWVLLEKIFYGYYSEEDARVRQNNLTRLQNAFHAADAFHPVLTITHDVLENSGAELACRRAEMSDVFGGSFYLEHQPGYMPDPAPDELGLPAYATARFITDITPLTSVPSVVSCTSGTSRYHGNNAFTMTPDKMTRMLLLFLAAGTKVVEFSHWKSARTGGHADKGGMVDWLDRLTPHAQAAGRIAQTAATYSQELWHSTSQPRVSILVSETSDMRTLATEDDWETSDLSGYPVEPTRARVGAARVLFNANIPFTFLSEQQFIAVTATPAPILFLPHIETLSTPLLLKLKEYAANGGRVVADMPTGYLNENGELLDTRPGSPFEALFGASIAGLSCFSNPAVKDAEPERGQQRANIVVTTARAGGGAGETPTFTENRVGKGRAVLVNASLSRLNAAPGLQSVQLSLLSYVLGSKQTALPGLAGCLTFRRSAEQAEHVFLVNDSNEERAVEIAVPARLTEARDALDVEAAPLAIENNAIHVTVEAGSGRWLRLSK